MKRLASPRLDRALVRRQRGDRLAQLVRAVEEEPRPLPRQLRPAQPRDRAARSRRAIPTARFWPSSPCTRRARLWRRLARRQLAATCTSGRSGTRASDFEHYYDGQAALLLRVRLPVLPDHARRSAASPSRSDWNATSPVMEFHQRDTRRQRPHRRDDDALFPHARRASRTSSISASSSRRSPSRRPCATGGA